MNYRLNLNSNQKFTPHRILILILIFLIFTVFLAIFTNSKRVPVALDRATPQGVVQAYLTSVMDGRFEVAASYLSAKSSCKVSDLDRAYLPKTSNVSLVKTLNYGTTSQVSIRVEMITDNPLENPVYEDHFLRLVHTDGKWKLLGVPWPLYDCGAALK